MCYIIFIWLSGLFLHCLSPECSVSAVADLVFLVDGSWSVGRENFKHIRSFIGALAGAFDIGEDKTRVAVVQYSTDTRTEFPLTRYTRRGDLLQAIASLPYKGGNTMTGKVFFKTRKLCSSPKDLIITLNMFNVLTYNLGLLMQE